MNLFLQRLCIVICSIEGISTTKQCPHPNSSLCNPSAIKRSNITPSIVQVSDTSPMAAPTNLSLSVCARQYTPEIGDTCTTVAEKFGLGVDTFMAWNPSVNPPSCDSLLSGVQYCVSEPYEFTSSWGGSSSPTGYTSLNSSPVAIPTPSTSASSGIYKNFTGDGSTGAGWPSIGQWLDFDHMWKKNAPTILESCDQWSVPRNNPTETSGLKSAISRVSAETSMDPRFVLAIILQESKGCVRVITTAYSHYNPGLMQSHEGSGTCNNNTANLELPGITKLFPVESPCPQDEIYQMVRDGVKGTKYGPGLWQSFKAQGYTDARGYYRTARCYNGGELIPQDLGQGCCTPSYVSDIANRLIGWVG